MSKEHHYTLNLEWTGNTGTGTSKYDAYERSHLININGKNSITCSSDAPFRGDVSKHNPEDFFLASLGNCHMLWYLHLCADAGVVVTKYIDNPIGILTQNENGSGQFTTVTLHPKVTITNKTMMEKAFALHAKANEFCFIANSVNFKIAHHPIILTEEK